MRVRDAVLGDVPAILAIYNDVVTNTTAIYDAGPSTYEQREAWLIDRQSTGMPVLVAEEGGEVLGFSSYGPWRPRWGYRFTVENSVHVRSDRRGQGIGHGLLEALFPLAREAGLHAMVAHIDSQASASLRLHERLGFERVGLFPQVAHKFDRWLDLVAMQRLI